MQKAQPLRTKGTETNQQQEWVEGDYTVKCKKIENTEISIMLTG
jgi:hypothetical protein